MNWWPLHSILLDLLFSLTASLWHWTITHVTFNRSLGGLCLFYCVWRWGTGSGHFKVSVYVRVEILFSVCRFACLVVWVSLSIHDWYVKQTTSSECVLDLSEGKLSNHMYENIWIQLWASLSTVHKSMYSKSGICETVIQPEKWTHLSVKTNEKLINGS